MPTRIALPLLVVLLWLAALPQVTMAADADLEQTLTRAEELYAHALATEARDERLALFREAHAHYRRLARHGIDSADLHTNSGNAALQAELIGEAVLAYRRAQLVDPDHPRAHQNLEQTRAQLPAWVPRRDPEGTLESFFLWHHTLSRPERTLAASIAFAVALLLVSVAVRWRRPWLRNIAVLPALAWAALLVSLWLEPATDPAEAVVVASQGTAALSADSPRARPVYAEPLPPGVELRILEERPGWLRIRVHGDRRDAWVRAGSVARVQPAQG